MDIGYITEYLYDSRGVGSNAVGQNDLFVAMRFAFNDIDSSELLFGITVDLDNTDKQIFRVEASTRLTNHFSVALEAWSMVNNDSSDILYSARNDDFVAFALEYYF